MSDENKSVYKPNNNERRSRITNPSPYTGLGKLPPQATDMEEAVLGALMLQKDALLDVIDTVKPAIFYRDNHQKICAVILKLFASDRPVDILTVTAELRKEGELEMIGGAYYITELTSRVASAANIEFHAKIIYQKYLQREMIRISTETINKAYEDTTDVFDIIDHNSAEVTNLMSDTHAAAVADVSDLIMERKMQLYDPPKDGLLGVGSGFTSLDRITNGWVAPGLVIIAARPAMGKAQPLDSKILTPFGYTQIGRVKVGSEICDTNGGIQFVTGIFPQGLKDTYTVTFSDGTKTKCCDEHLWLTSTMQERKSKRGGSVKSLKQIMANLHVTADNRRNHSVKFVEPVFFHKIDLLIHPYVMGVFLGDGSASHLSITNPEVDIIDKVSQLLPVGCRLRKKKDTGKCDEYRFVRDSAKKENIFKELLIKYNLDTSLSADKCIPFEYLRSSVDDRLELLRGLLDTDGYVVYENCIEFSTVSNMLKVGMIDLVRSLGGRITYSVKQGQYKKNGIQVICQKYYRMNISFASDIIPVSSEKHLSKYCFSRRSLEKFIDSVVKNDEQEECICISVSSKDRLYITDEYIPTHNTAFMLSCARNAVAEFGKKGLIFSLEMSKMQLVDRIISSETEIPLDKISKGSLDDYETNRLETGTVKLDVGKNLFIDDTAAISILELRAKAKRFKIKYDIQWIMVDYLQLMRGLPDKMGIREQEISSISRGLKALAKELNIPVIALSQLSRAVESRPGGSKRPMLSDLRESGAIEQDADMVLFLYRPEYYGLTEDEDGNPTQGVVEVIIAKHRSGVCDTVRLRANLSIMKFFDLDTDFSSDTISNPVSFTPSPNSNFIIRPNYMRDDDDDEPPF